LKFRLDFVLDDVEGCARVASTLNRRDKAEFAAAFGNAVHHVHDGIDDSPSQIAADGSGK
jgi:hypothetical protein